MRRLKLRNLTICLCMICVVAFSVATPIVRVSALAQEITPELEPVYDTEVVSLQDYVDNVLTDAQVAVFNTILGSYVASQAGLNEYDLEYPYTERTGVIGWLQDAGMKLYNAIITGGSFDLVTGTDLRTYIVTAASYAIGMAQKAHTYTDMDDFLDDIDNSDHYFIPYDPILQASINSYFGRSYGLWNWQFDSQPFVANFTWKTSPDLTGTLLDGYNSYVNTYLNGTNIRINPTTQGGYYNVLSSFQNQYNLFINSTNNTCYLVDDNGNMMQSFYSQEVYYYSPDYRVYHREVGFSPQIAYLNGLTGTYREIIQTVLDNQDTRFTNYNLLKVNDMYVDLTKLISHYYVGANWATKQEIFNLTDLNFQQNDSPSYNQVPDNSYIDLKGFLTDIVNNTNILNVILDNLFKPDGTLNVDPTLVKVSITIPDTNPLPVNLNDVSEIIDNTYLDLVKERAKQASETIGEYVAFWHNCDPEVVYVSLGAILIIAIGAFIGKWGHS